MSDQEAKPPKMGYEGHPVQAAASLGDDLWELHSAGQKISEFTAGRTLSDFQEIDVLQAAVLSMLQLMNDAAFRIASHSPEIGNRLEAVTELHTLMQSAPETNKMWRFIEGSLPALASSTAEELEQWHSS